MYRPTTEPPHKSGDPFSCGCRRCSDRRKDRLAAQDQGIDWRNSPELALDHEERSILSDAEEQQRKFNTVFDARVNATIESELQRSREQYEREQRDRAAREAALAANNLPPPEVLNKLPDGTTQLPLNADPDVIRKASRSQQRDLTRRQFAVFGRKR